MSSLMRQFEIKIVPQNMSFTGKDIFYNTTKKRPHHKPQVALSQTVVFSLCKS